MQSGKLIAPASLLFEPRHLLAPLAVEQDVLLEARAAEAFGHLAGQALGVLAQEFAW